MPYKKGQMRNSYGLIRESYGKVVSGVAVQDGAKDYINPNTNKLVTPAEIYQFAKDYLGLNYIFWGSEEPFLKDQVAPFLGSIKN